MCLLRSPRGEGSQRRAWGKRGSDAKKAKRDLAALASAPPSGVLPPGKIPSSSPIPTPPVTQPQPAAPPPAPSWNGRRPEDVAAPTAIHVLSVDHFAKSTA